MIDEPPPARPTVLKGDRRPDMASGSRLAGNGRTLMIMVLTGVGVLLIASLVLAGYALRRAMSVDDTTGRSETRLEPSDSRADPESRNPADWITADDYPPEAIRRRQEGIVAIRWQVGDDGRATGCIVTASSGHANLDRAACGAILRSARYPPMVAGTPPRSYARRVVWRMPD